MARCRFRQPAGHVGVGVRGGVRRRGDQRRRPGLVTLPMRPVSSQAVMRQRRGRSEQAGTARSRRERLMIGDSDPSLGVLPLPTVVSVARTAMSRPTPARGGSPGTGTMCADYPAPGGSTPDDGEVTPCPVLPAPPRIPEVALYCYRCGTSLRGSASTRAGSYAVQSSEGVNQFALISTIMPHTNRADRRQLPLGDDPQRRADRGGHRPRAAADRHRRGGLPDPDRLPRLHLRREHVGGRTGPGRRRPVPRHRRAGGPGHAVLLPLGLRRAVQLVRGRRRGSASSRCRSRRC